MGAITRPKSEATYDALLEFAKEEVQDQRGDVLEIGAFVGCFTKRLAEHFHDRIVYAVDVFNPRKDEVMGSLYEDWLNGNDQFQEYRKNTGHLQNVITLACDSAILPYCMFPDGLSFVYIDGGHSEAKVRSDLTLAWNSLNRGGLVVLDDYGTNLPTVTKAIDAVVNGYHKLWRTTTYHLKDMGSFAIRLDGPK